MYDENEYFSFLAKLVKAAKELNEDFNKLSPETKVKIEHEVNQAFNTFSFARILNILDGKKD